MNSDLRDRRPAQPDANPVSHAVTRGVIGVRSYSVGWDELLPWYKDNEFIRTGYRPLSYSYLESFRSCFHLHNETGSIYSHLLATIWMIVLPVLVYPYAKSQYPRANADDWTVFALFFLGGTLCFGLSTIYHTLSNHSRRIYDLYLRLDLLGIITVTAGCFPPGLWYTFPCASRRTRIFWVGVSKRPQKCLS